MKRGISLIAVLMFMLAATTASIVVFRMLSSEGFSSGARLKASEAYQASESGIDAVRSWLANRGTETGDLVTQYMDKTLNPGKKPVEINLGDANAFKAYIVGVDASGGNSKPVRMKVLVEGKGRDNSVVTQAAILSVSGLYKTTIPDNSDYIPPPTSSSSLSEPPSSSSATTQQQTVNLDATCIESSVQSSTKCVRTLPDLWGNMATAGIIEARTMIITQTMETCNGGGQALNRIKIGTPKEPGWLILDGNFYANNGIKIYGNLYSTGTFNMCASGSDSITGNVYVKNFHPRVSTGTLTIGGSAYFADTVNPNVESFRACSGGAAPTNACFGQLGGSVNIKGNTTIKGPYFAYTGNGDGGTAGGGGSLHFIIDNNLVMGNNSYINLFFNNKDNISTSKFEVKKNVSIGKFIAQNKNYSSSSVLWPIFGDNSSSNLCVTPSVSGPTNSGGYNIYTYNGTNPFYFKTKSTNGMSSCGDTSSWNADPMAYLKAEVEVPAGKKSCEYPPVKFETDDIYRKSIVGTEAWVHKDGKPGRCNVENGKMKISNPWTNLLDELNTCWKNKGSNELYKNEWFVIHIKNQHKYGEVNGNLGNGKYIVIFDFDKPYNLDYYDFLYLPPTGPNAYVMIYLPNGFPGTIELAGTEIGKSKAQSEYNYFIFSDGDIGQFNTTAERKLHGNIFMNNCATINISPKSQNPYFYSEGNDAFVDQLMKSNILSNIQYGDNNTCINTTYTLGCTLTPSGTIMAGKEIIKPTFTDFEVMTSPTLNWSNPSAGSYDVRIKGKAGKCSGVTEPKLCGTLTVSSSSVALSSSSSTPVSSSSLGSSSGTSNSDGYEDEPWIPISAHLEVKVESKEISKEKLPPSPKGLDKTILVMPRAVRIAEGVDVSDGDKLKKYYSYIPLNGAKKSDATTSNPDCKNQGNELFGSATPSGVYTCSFTGTAVRHTSFYVVVGAGSGIGGGGGGGDEATCVFGKSQYTHGENIQMPTVVCKDNKTLSDMSLDNYLGLEFAKNGENYYYPGPEEGTAMISVSGTCDTKSFSAICNPIEIKQPTCSISGEYHPICDNNGINCNCATAGSVSAPNYSCGTAAKAQPSFSVSTANNGAISLSAPAWNTGSATNCFNSTGINRVVRMYKVSCGGHELSYGTPNSGGIECGSIDIIDKSSGGGGSLTNDCDKFTCSPIDGCYKVNVGVSAPVYNCGGGSPSNPKFKYSTGTSISSTTPSWDSSKVHYFQSEGDRNVYMYQITCGGTTFNCGTSSNPQKPCGSLKISNSCASAVTATCNWNGAGKTVFSGENNPYPFSAGNITCSDGTAPAFTWGSGATLNNDSPSKGTYTPVPSTCGGKAISNTPSCGTLTVKQKPTVNTCSGVSNQTVTLPNTPTQPTITLSDPDNVCNSTLTNLNWTVSKGGNRSGPDWASLFTETGSYTGYSVSGKCGSVDLTSTCSGNANVNAATSITCSISGTYYLGSSGCVNVPAPTVSSCTSPGNLTFRIDNAASGTIPKGWSSASAGANGEFCSTRTTSVYMTAATCNGSSANLGGGINCGTITIAQSSQSSSSSTPSSSSGGGGGTVSIASGSWSNMYNPNGGTDMNAGTFTITCGTPAAPFRCWFPSTSNATTNVTGTTNTCNDPNTHKCVDFGACSSITSVTITGSGVKCMNAY